MRKIFCKLFGHKYKQAYSGSLILCCERCGRVSEFSEKIEKLLFKEDLLKEDNNFLLKASETIDKNIDMIKRIPLQDNNK